MCMCVCMCVCVCVCVYVCVYVCVCVCVCVYTSVCLLNTILRVMPNRKTLCHTSALIIEWEDDVSVWQTSKQFLMHV